MDSTTAAVILISVFMLCFTIYNIASEYFETRYVDEEED